MIRIRYRDSSEFSPGLHAAAERHGRTTTIYLLSGLTAPERGSALRRLRLSARMGHGPRLPAVQLLFALLDDRIRTAVGRAGAVFRLHPAGSALPVMVLSGGAIAFLLLSTVSIRVLPAPRTGPRSSVSGTSPMASAGPIPIAGASRGPTAGLGGPGDLGQGSDSGQLTKPRPGGSSAASPPSLAGPGGGQGGGAGTGTDTGSAATGSGSGTGSGGWTLSGPTPASAPTTASSTPAPAATPPQGAAAPSSSAPEPAPSSATQGSGGLCVDVGPLGLCLNV
jgi:hypothetical protein